MDRIPVDYLPDDAPWTSTRLPLGVLKTQCTRRGLPADGDRQALQQRLLDYEQANIIIPRSRKWEMRPYQFESQLHHWYWRFHQHLVTRVRNKSDAQGDLRKCFTITSRDQNDVLRDVLSCLEPLRWQQSFLPSEIELIYRHSPAARSRVHKDKYIQGDFCFVCFKEHIEQGVCVPCTTCGMPMDTNCYQNFKKARCPTANKEGQCIVCLDKAAWDVEKYREQHQAPLAAAIASVQAQEPLLVENDAHSSIEVEEIPDSTSPGRSSSTPLSNLDDSGSNWSDFHEDLDNNDHGDEKSDNDTYADEDATSPFRPLHRPHDTAETTPLTQQHQQQQQEREQQQLGQQHQQQQQQQHQQQQQQQQQHQQQQQQQKQKQQQQQQKQKQVQALRPVITSVRVSMLRDSARGQVEEEERNRLGASIAVVSPGPDDSNLEPASASTPTQTPAPAPLPASASVPVLAYTTPSAPDVQLAHSPPPAAPDAAPQAVEAQATSTSAGNDVSSGFPAPPVRASPAVGAASDPAGTGTLDSAHVDANTTIATTLDNNNITDRKAAKQARKLKRLAKKSDRLRKQVEKAIGKLNGVEKKAKKRALARGMEGVEDDTE
ncbi:hypothetical protein N0V85_003476 [Neurospora sp. IMI 360204]|nr:hypothetical protein N0V85_003476 [Neurospora sp. IMI 360204]